MSETVQENLARADNETLLATFASLTHALHNPKSVGHEISLRQQRDLVHDEIIRRMERNRLMNATPVKPCPCECNSGGFCGGCGHAGCGGRR